MFFSRTIPVGVMTREQAKSSAQPIESMDKLARKVDNLSRRKINPSKQTGPPKETTPESEVAATSPLGSDHGDDTDPIAVQVWDEMFENKPFHKIAGKSDFLQNQVLRNAFLHIIKAWLKVFKYIYFL